MAILNGRRVDPSYIPNAGVYGSEIIKEMGLGPGRRPTFVKDGGNEFIQPGKLYTKPQVLDRKGRPLKVTDIPDRTKGAEGDVLFGGVRSAMSKAIITEQVIDLADNLYKRGLDFDEDNADWMVVPEYRLPDIWQSIARTTPLLIMFPTHYPEIPPVGCYLKAKIPQSPNGHFYTDAYHQASKAPLEHGYKWFCVFVEPGNWRPARVSKPGDWKRGDNLWTYMTLISEALASPG